MYITILMVVRRLHFRKGVVKKTTPSVVCHRGQCDMVVEDYNLKEAKMQTSLSGDYNLKEAKLQTSLSGGRSE
jgi:hypothetical protein